MSGRQELCAQENATLRSRIKAQSRGRSRQGQGAGMASARPGADARHGIYHCRYADDAVVRPLNKEFLFRSISKLPALYGGERSMRLCAMFRNRVTSPKGSRIASLLTCQAARPALQIEATETHAGIRCTELPVEACLSQVWFGIPAGIWVRNLLRPDEQAIVQALALPASLAA